MTATPVRMLRPARRTLEVLLVALARFAGTSAAAANEGGLRGLHRDPQRR